MKYICCPICGSDLFTPNNLYFECTNKVIVHNAPSPEFSFRRNDLKNLVEEQQAFYIFKNVIIEIISYYLAKEDFYSNGIFEYDNYSQSMFKFKSKLIFSTKDLLQINKETEDSLRNKINTYKTFM